VDGVLSVIQHFSEALVLKSLAAEKNPDQFSPVIHPEPPMPEFQRLHDGIPMDSWVEEDETGSNTKKQAP
jgi:hypothetical protein